MRNCWEPSVCLCSLPFPGLIPPDKSVPMHLHENRTGQGRGRESIFLPTIRGFWYSCSFSCSFSCSCSSSCSCYCSCVTYCEGGVKKYFYLLPYPPQPPLSMSADLKKKLYYKISNIVPIAKPSPSPTTPTLIHILKFYNIFWKKIKYRLFIAGP